jgi:hypothetical protein
MPKATFYFDLGSPFAYLAAERVHEALPEPVRWQPVSLGALFKLADRRSWSVGDRAPPAVGGGGATPSRGGMAWRRSSVVPAATGSRRCAGPTRGLGII